MSKDTKALNYQTDSLVVINRVADALYQSSAFDQSLQNAMRIVQNYTSADMITFLEVNPENASLERRASENLVEDVIYQQPIPLEGSLSGLTISRQEIITSADIANDERIEPAIRSALDKHGLHFVISVPVTYQEQAVAVTNLFYCEMPNIPDRAYETLLAIGKILGAALKQAEMPVQELKQSGPLAEITSLDGLEIISDLAQKMLVSADVDAMLQEALQTAVTALNITSAYISEFDEDELKEKIIAEYVSDKANDLERQSDLGETYPLDIDFRERIEQLKTTPYYIEDIEDSNLSETVKSHLQTFGAKTVLGVPLIVKSKLVGLLDLWESRESREFTEAEITIAQAIATQLAVSLNNSHLYEKTNKELQERRKVEETLQRNEVEARKFQEQLNTLQEVNIELARIDSLPELYEQIIVLARTKLGFDRIGLLLYDQDTQMMHGTFGTDDEGEIRDERYFSHPVDDEELEVFAQKLPFKAWETTELKDEGNAVGVGWHAMAVLWYEDTPIGWISADNLLKREPLSQNLMELMRLYASTIAHLIVRQRSEDSLRQKELEARIFQEKLNILQEVNLELARATSLPQLYEQVIVLGRERLGFDRIGLLLFDQKTKTMFGTFGTDDVGEVRDEQYFSQVVENKEILEVIAKKKPFRVWESTELVDEGKAVGQGWNAMAVLWYEDTPLGWIAADNFLKKEPLSSNLMELMRLFAITVAHLIVRQRSEDSLREREERARTFQEKLQALQETSIELGITQSADELYRRAIELGQEKLGFKRLGLLLYDEKTEMIQGTFGTDIEGNIVDEREFTQGIWNTLREVIAEKKRLAIWEDVPLYNDSEIVGHGWSAIAVLWNGNKGLGWLATDNLLTQEAASQEHLDLLMLYGDVLGHLITQKESEQTLQERENLLQIVLDTIPQSVFWKDVNSVYLGSNRNFTRDAGIESPQALIGKTDYDIVKDKKEAKRFWELDQRVIQSGESELNLLSTSFDANGKEVWYSTNKVPLHDAKGEVIGILGTYEDITERRAAELELQRREEEYRDLYIDAPVAYVSLALDGTIEQANLRAAEILQVKLENLLGRKMGDFYADTPNGKKKAYGFADKLASGETILDEEIEVVTARGKELWIAITIQPNLDENGKLHSMRAAATDITEQKRAEEALRNAELNLRKQNERLVDLAKSDAITSGDLNQVFREITETAVDVIDVARASIWYYEPDKIELADLFEQEAKAHSDGLVLYEKDYPSYFKALQKEGKIIANDAHRNSRTSEFSEGYLTPLGITSMFDTTAQVGGKTQAVLCLEHVGKRRSWTIEEQNFANSLSDLLALAMEANNRQIAQKALEDSEAKMRKQNERLITLAKSDAITGGNLNAVFQEITETAVDVIDVARASIWYYEPDKIELANLYEKEAKKHSDGLTLYAKDYPAYFQALRDEGAITANDAHQSPHTSEFSEGYLTPLGISSMLDTTAQVGGKTQAVLCLEHVGKQRRWTIEEQNFVNSLSDLLALAMEANERQKAEEELHESLTFRSQQFEIGQALAQAQSEEAVINTLVNYAEYYKHVAISVTVLEREEDGLVDVTKASNAFDSGVQLTPAGTRNSHAKQPLAQYYSRDKAFISADMADDERVGKRIGKMFKSFGIRSMAILPMSAGGEWIGNMTLMTAQVDFFNDRTLAIYRTLAEQGAISLRGAYLNARIQETLARREREVRVSTQIAQEIASATDLTDLYTRVVTQIQEQFGYYFTQLLRYDTALDSIALIEGYGEIGQRMVELNHSVPQGVGIIGTAAATGKPVLRPNVTDDPTWQPNPLLPNTKGELSVPIKIGDNVLGVLDVQSDKANQLNENDVLVLEGLCGQIAIAIESTTLRQDMENRLRELNALQRQMSKDGWQQYQAMRQDVVGYQYDHGGVHPLAAPAALRESNGNGQSDEILNTPLQVRGETIGLLGIENDPKRPLTDDDREFLDAITREIAEALESARLFEQTQTALNEQERLTAELETVAQVSTAASTILEIDALLQSVVDLAKTSFGLYHAHIYLINENETRLQLKAGAGNIGRLMTLEGREIGLDTESLVARAARTRQGVLSNNVRKTIDYLPHPLLPKTQSELAVPMIVGDKLVGVMDLQSNELDFFSEEDLKIQRTLASQIAVAVENALQYAEQVQTASKLRELDQLKSEFLASMSHELRTPLNSIIGFADVLLEGLDGELNERMEEDVRLIRESGRHLRELIGDILDMSKIESGHMELRYEEINMPQLANDIVATASSLAQEKKLLLNLDIDEHVSTIQADRTRLRQILWNITGNAIKFTEKGSVTLAMHHREDHILVSIRDTGIGIKEENIAVVFEQFRQIDGGLNRTAGGTGLGMPITKKLVELHGGEIWIESVYGQGSTFLFTIPYDISKRRDRDESLDTSGLDGI